MPVTIKPSPENVGRHNDASSSTESDLYDSLVKAWNSDDQGLPTFSKDQDEWDFSARASFPVGKPVLHSSFTGLGGTDTSPVTPYKNGFVNGVIRAFQQHIHLTIRPDDVWLAILIQFSFYVNKHAEALRKQFVEHDGQVKLTVSTSTPFFECDIGDLAEKFVPLMQEKLSDPDVRDWLLPVFSTTTTTDLAVSSMVMMATMKEYFKFQMLIGCGFPSVTLLGEAGDWQMILERLEKFAQYGAEPAVWSKLLTPVIKRFIATFYMPDSTELKDFWMRAVYSIGAPGSGREGPPYNGWLTAFMFWDSHGHHRESSWTVDANQLPPLELDGERFSLIPYHRAGVPSGVVEVPVLVDALDLGLRFQTTLVAGTMGVTVRDGPQGDPATMVQPCSGWWMLEDSREPL
jgi:hypothetical protein